MTLVDKASFFQISEEMEDAHMKSLQDQFEHLQNANRSRADGAAEEQQQLKVLFDKIAEGFSQVKSVG